MKKIVGRNKNGEIVFYEEVKDIKELEGVKIEKSTSPRDEFFNYWLVKNWDFKLELQYFSIKLILFLIYFPFIVIRRCFLILMYNDWGEEYSGFADFFKNTIIPILLVSFLLYLFPGRQIISICREAEEKRQMEFEEKTEKFRKAKEASDAWKEEVKRRKQNGEVYIGGKTGWYKIQGLPEDYNPVETDLSKDPPGWEKYNK